MQTGVQVVKGTWYRGIAPAQHARGLGFNRQCVHSLAHPSYTSFQAARLIVNGCEAIALIQKARQDYL